MKLGGLRNEVVLAMKRASVAFGRLRDFVRQSRDVSRLGETPAQTCRLLLASCVLAIDARRQSPGARPVFVRMRFGGESLPCVITQFSDIQVLQQVFVWEQYKLEADLDPRVIFDAGSNSGFSVLYFRIRHPQARIFALEPDSAAFAKLQFNTRGRPGIIARRVALASADESRTFYRSSQSWVSSLLPAGSWISPDEASPLDQVPEDVEARTLRSLMADFGVERVDLLKLDIEGAEWEILPELARMQSVGAVLGELHWDVETAPVSRASDDLLPGFDVSFRGGSANRCDFLALRPETAGRSRDLR